MIRQQLLQLRAVLAVDMAGPARFRRVGLRLKRGRAQDQDATSTPVRKPTGKERHGAKVTKRYDTAATPYRRLLASGVLDAQQEAALDERYRRLNPAQLKRDIDAALDLLWTLAEPHIAHPNSIRAAAS